MLNAIYVGLSGLNAYSRGLQQVSNNVANLNSTGFKGANVTFSDLYQLQGRGGRSLGAESGGGNGVAVGDTQRDLKQGELRQTDRDLDLAIDGAGYLVLLRGNEVFYTRTGSFEVNRDGFIVLAGTEYRLATLDGSGKAVSLSIDSKRTSPPVKSTTIKFADNLSSTATTHTISDVHVYSAEGVDHVWKLAFTRDTNAGAGVWTLKVTDAAGATVATQTVKFSNGTIDPTTASLTIAADDGDLPITLDFSAATSFSSGEVSTLRAASVDGHATGTITTVTVNEKGRIEIKYSNEEKADLGAVAIGDFRSPQALEDRGGGLFVDQGKAGGELTTSDDPRSGKVLARRLEASNVDLSKQFGDLILIQRGFQASSQIISVANDMIQQLFGIRGQG